MGSRRGWSPHSRPLRVLWDHLPFHTRTWLSLVLPGPQPDGTARKAARRKEPGLWLHSLHPKCAGPVPLRPHSAIPTFPD